jgi:hypothetical protein
MMFSTRVEAGRVILDVAHVPFSGAGGEGGVAYESASRIRALNPDGFQGVIYDMALRGVHIERIMRLLGMPVIAKVPAKESYGRKGKRGGRRVPKETLMRSGP